MQPPQSAARRRRIAQLQAELEAELDPARRRRLEAALAYFRFEASGPVDRRRRAL